MDNTNIIAALRLRTKKELPKDWIVGLRCPEPNCDTLSDRPRCAWELGTLCPRNDPNAYAHSPFVEVTDELCAEAAALIEEFQTKLDEELKFDYNEAYETGYEQGYENGYEANESE